MLTLRFCGARNVREEDAASEPHCVVGRSFQFGSSNPENLGWPKQEIKS